MSKTVDYDPAIRQIATFVQQSFEVLFVVGALHNQLFRIQGANQVHRVGLKALGLLRPRRTPYADRSFAGDAQSAEGRSKEKIKVLYRMARKDPEVAKYARALINKHIEAEGGPEDFDMELVVHGPALELFERD